MGGRASVNLLAAEGRAPLNLLAAAALQAAVKLEEAEAQAEPDRGAAAPAL